MAIKYSFILAVSEMLVALFARDGFFSKYRLGERDGLGRRRLYTERMDETVIAGNHGTYLV